MAPAIRFLVLLAFKAQSCVFPSVMTVSVWYKRFPSSYPMLDAVCSSGLSLSLTLFLSLSNGWQLIFITGSLGSRDEASLLFWKQHGRYSTRLSQPEVWEVIGVQGTPLSIVPTINITSYIFLMRHRTYSMYNQRYCDLNKINDF